MKTVDIKSSTHTDFGIGKDEKNPKFKLGDRVRILKYKNIFAKDYIPNWSEEACIIKKVKNNVPWKYVISYLNDEDVMKKNWKRNQTDIRAVKVIKRKCDKLYVKWKDYDNSFDSWIDKKGIFI